MDKPDRPPLPSALSAAVLEAAALLAADPALVEERALEILKFAPGQPHALSMLVAARRISGDLPGARDHLQELAQREPNLAAIYYELGLLHAELGDAQAAIAALSRATELEPEWAQAWRAIGDQLAKSGRADAAANAYGRHLEQVRSLDPALRGNPDQLPDVERDLRQWTALHPTDAAALRMLGGVCLRLGRTDEAEKHLAQAIALSPGFSVARWVLAWVLSQRDDSEGALSQVEILLREKPKSKDYLNFKADMLTQLRRFEHAIACYEELLSEHPNADSWMYYGHALTTMGRQQEGIAAYRNAIELEPTLGRAYWSLANMKTFRFNAEDVVAMSRLVDGPDLDSDNRIQMYFALGK